MFWIKEVKLLIRLKSKIALIKQRLKMFRKSSLSHFIITFPSFEKEKCWVEFLNAAIKICFEDFLKSFWTACLCMSNSPGERLEIWLKSHLFHWYVSGQTLSHQSKNFFSWKAEESFSCLVPRVDFRLNEEQTVLHLEYCLLIVLYNYCRLSAHSMWGSGGKVLFPSGFLGLQQ